jgi:hypothetical protein
VALGAGEEKRLSEKPTQTFAAYEAFLKAEDASSPATPRQPLRRQGLHTCETPKNFHTPVRGD